MKYHSLLDRQFNYKCKAMIDSTGHKLYVDTSVTPHRGITLSEIERVLGDYTCRNAQGRPDLGLLCKSKNINPDSLFKPYECAGPINPDFLTGGPDGQYGYNIPMVQSGDVFQLRNALWTFNPPQSMFRALDFSNYHHGVKYAANAWGLSVTETSSTVMCSFDFGGADGLVCPRNMKLFENAYAAVAIYGGDSIAAGLTMLRVQCGSAEIGSAAGELITVHKSDYDTSCSTLILVPFISEYHFTDGSDVSAIGTWKKWSFNYKSSQAKDLALPPTIRYTPELTAVLESGYACRITPTLTNNTSNTIMTSAYLLYRLREGLDATGNVLYDAYTYNAGVNPSWNGIVLPGDGSLVLNSRSISFGGASYPNAKSIELRWYDPTGALGSGSSQVYSVVNF